MMAVSGPEKTLHRQHVRNNGLAPDNQNGEGERHNMKKTIIGLFALGLALFGTLAIAENSTKADGYTIHHNALTTDLLTPEIARAYRIPRSRNRGMLNISVIKDEEGSTGKAVAADVRAFSTNFMGQISPIPLREIREGEAIYYIGDFLVRHGETLNFTMEVRPAGETAFFAAKMSQEFFTRD